MVAYLSKSDASEGFNQIIDFLNGSSIKYALMVNPNICVSCIKQFWTTVVVKQVNDVPRLQALVDKKKVVVREATIREALCLDDEEGVECLPNEEIFAELARMGYEKPSTKLMFYKAFFSSQVGKGFSRVETPLFKSMLVEQQVHEEGDADENVKEVNAGDAAEGDVSAAHGEVPTVQPTPPQSPQVQPPSPQPQPQPLPHQDAEFDKVAQALEITKLKRRVKKLERRNKVRVLKLRRLQRVGTSQRVETSDETVMDDVSNQERMIAEVDADADVVLEDVKEAVDEAKEVAEDANLITKVVTAASETITAASTNITAAEAQVPATTLTAAPARVTAAPSRKRKGVDKGKGILVEELKHLKKKQQIKLNEQYDRELHAELNKDIDWDEVIDHVKIKAKEDHAVKKYQALKRKPQTEAQARKNMMMYLKNVVGFKMDYFKGMSYDDIRPIFEAKFNSNVAFLLKTKEQIKEDENKALEDLGALWSLVKERFYTTKPKNFFDDFLLVTLGAMFEKPDIHAQIKKNQRSVHGLAKRKYPLTRLILDQMLNAVRLEVEEESKVSLELLRFTQQQHQEAQLE
nr:hypothetical protein [Tanacetum cinerariifolium]